jgi:hypothetical protein
VCAEARKIWGFRGECEFIFGVVASCSLLFVLEEHGASTFRVEINLEMDVSLPTRYTTKRPHYTTAYNVAKYTKLGNKFNFVSYRCNNLNCT